MLKNEIQQLNPWWEKGYKKEAIIPRPIYTGKILNSDTKQIQVIVGARRVGKTYILKNTIDILLKSVKPKEIFYITAELPNISGLTLMELIDHYKIINNTSKLPSYLFIDEVQDLKDWQIQVKYIYDNYKSRIFLSGSSGLILTKETSKLTGRFLLTHVYPLSYREFISFKKNATIKEYLDIGGYPEYVVSEEKDVLLQTVEGTMYRDLLSYYGIRNPIMLKDLLQLLCDKVTTAVSDITIAKDLRVDTKTAQFYLSYLQDVFLIYPLFRAGKSHKKIKGFSPKYYINDTGLLKLFSRTPREGHLMENAVFLHLNRLAQTQNVDLNFDFLETGEEVDFTYNKIIYDVKAGLIPQNFSDKVTYIVQKRDINNLARQIELEKLLLIE